MNGPNELSHILLSSFSPFFQPPSPSLPPPPSPSLSSTSRQGTSTTGARLQDQLYPSATNRSRSSRMKRASLYASPSSSSSFSISVVPLSRVASAFLGNFVLGEMPSSAHLSRALLSILRRSNFIAIPLSNAPREREGERRQERYNVSRACLLVLALRLAGG